jgi:hypothetical protein
MTIEQIKEKWQTGDANTIHKMTGLSQHHIRMVINGDRNNKRVIAAAIKVIESRENLMGQA